LVHSGANGKMLLYINDGTYDSYTYSSSAIPENQWIHVAFVLNTDTQRCQIYKNGILFGSSGNYASTDVPAGMPSILKIGENFQGKLTDFRIYNTDLSQEDIEEIYKQKANIDSNGNFYSLDFNETGHLPLLVDYTT
jgi:hypothetical protein